MYRLSSFWAPHLRMGDALGSRMFVAHEYLALGVWYTLHEGE